MLLLVGDEAGKAGAIIMDRGCWCPRGRDRVVSADGGLFVKAFASGLLCCRCRLLDGKKNSANASISLVLSGSSRDGSSPMRW